MTNRSNVISGVNSEQHVVESYHFKVISEFNNEQDNNQTTQAPQNNVAKEQNSQNASIEENKEQNSQTTNTFQSDFIEDLLKKTDEMSANISKLQMQIENQENEFNTRLNSELENAKEKYSKEGYEQAKTEFDQQIQDLKEKYLKSISKLDEACVNLDNFISKNEKELADAAIDIAKEVIMKEIDFNSSQIAYNLAKDLINQLKGASSIEIKVNSNDYEFIKANFGNNEKIKISLDDAITKGSVIVLSDVGNIESNLNSRLMKIKKMVNNEE